MPPAVMLSIVTLFILGIAVTAMNLGRIIQAWMIHRSLRAAMATDRKLAGRDAEAGGRGDRSHRAEPGCTLVTSGDGRRNPKGSIEARAEDHALLRETRDALTRSIGRLDGIVERGQAADYQLRRVIWAGFGGALGGMLLMAILPGAVARSLPPGWHVPSGWLLEQSGWTSVRRESARSPMPVKMGTLTAARRPKSVFR